MRECSPNRPTGAPTFKREGSRFYFVVKWYHFYRNHIVKKTSDSKEGETIFKKLRAGQLDERDLR